MSIIGKITVFITSVFYISVGIKHFIDPNWFLTIIPTYLKFIGLELVYIFEENFLEKNQKIMFLPLYPWGNLLGKLCSNIFFQMHSLL